MKIAFIGLGNMGGPMAHNLHKAGHEVRAFDLSQPARDKLAADGVPIAADAKAAVAGAEVVISMLPASQHVEGLFLGAEYARREWVQQYHIGALRNNNLRQFKLLGPDVGFDSINDRPLAEELSKLLSKQNEQNLLPKTILYCLNPRDNEVLGTMIGNFFEKKPTCETFANHSTLQVGEGNNDGIYFALGN